MKGKVEFSAASAFLEHSARPLLDGVVALLATRPHLSVRIEVRWWLLLVFVNGASTELCGSGAGGLVCVCAGPH